VFPVAAVAAGWLLVLIVLLVVPPSVEARRNRGPGDGSAPAPPRPGGPAPAVVSLLAGKLGKSGFAATLIDLAARGWFQVSAPSGPAGQGGARAPAGPAMCVVPAEAPAEVLTPFERRVVAHVARRAGAHGQVPAPALSDGFEAGENDFMTAFREEVVAEERRWGLTRHRLSPRRIGLLCALLFVPAVAVLAAAGDAHRHDAPAYAGVAYLVGFVLILSVGTSRRRTAAGQAVLDRWRSAVAAGPWEGRLPGYAAALGAAPAAVAAFAPAGNNMAWSSYRGGWQQIEIETNTWPWPRACLILVAITVAPIAYAGGAIWLGTHGMAAQAAELVGLTAGGLIAGVLAWLAHRALFPGRPSSTAR